MKPTASERFAVGAVAVAAALILAMTAQALPLSYLIELAMLCEHFCYGALAMTSVRLTFAKSARVNVTVALI